jgi:hypothetical protein
MTQPGSREALAAPAVGQVNWGSLRRLTSISPIYGFDRGRPIDRYYIEGFLERCSSDVSGHVLEVEDNTYTKRFGSGRVTRSEVLYVHAGHPGTTIVADLADASEIPSNMFDCVILTQTLQYIYDLHAALATLRRILRPAGVLLATFPGLSRTSDPQWGDTWHWNLTSRSARRLFSEFFPARTTQVQGHGNILVAVACLHGLADEELQRDELDYYDAGFEVCITVRAVRPSGE